MDALSVTIVNPPVEIFHILVREQLAMFWLLDFRSGITVITPIIINNIIIIIIQSSWLQIRRPGFDSRHYQKEK
jgi:hypothetical protein